MIKFVEEKGLLVAKIFIDPYNWGNLKAFSKSHKLFETSEEDPESNQLYFQPVKLDIAEKDRRPFLEHLKGLLLANLKSNKGVDIDKQVEELIYIAYELSTLSIEEIYRVDESDDYKRFAQILKVYDLVNEMNGADSLKITLVQPGSKTNPSVILPKANDNRVFYNYLSNAIHQYFLNDYKSFGNKWYLFGAYKNEVTLAKMIKKQEERFVFPFPDEDTLTGLYLTKLIPYLRLLPQFPEDKTKRRSTITKAQCIFIDGYLSLFGLYKHSLDINLKRQGTYKSRKQLRMILSRFNKNYNFDFK